MTTIVPNSFADKLDTVKLSDLDENFNYLAVELDTKSSGLSTDINNLTETVNNIVIDAGLSTSVFTKQIYLQVSTPPNSPSGGTYNFQTNTFVPPTGWFATRPPSSTIPTYACEYTFSTNTPSATVTATTWSAVSIIAQNGTSGNSGVSTFTMEIYSVNNPVTPSGGKYTFSTDTFDAATLSSGWSRAMPTTSIVPTYRSSYTFSTTTPNVQQNAGSWSTPIIVAVNGTDGVDSISASLSNSAHTIPTDSAGLNGVYTGSGTQIHVYEGSNELIYNGVGTSNGTWKVVITSSNITAGSITNVNPYINIGNHSNITSDTASITYTITGKRADGTPFTNIQVQTFSRVRTGFDATAYKISVTAPVLSKSSTGIFTPSTFTISAVKLSGATPTPYTGRFKIYENEDTLATYTSSVDEATKTYFPSVPAVNKITIELYQAGGTSVKLDTETVVVVMDGANGTNGTDGNSGLDALISVLSNDAQTIPTDSAGNNGVYTNSGTTIRVFEGTTELAYDGVGTASGSWKVVPTGSSITPGTVTDSGVYATVGAHSNMTANTASVDYLITGKRANGIAFSLTKTQSFSKARAGVAGNPGVDSTSYSLVLSTNVLQKSVSGVFNPTSFNITSLSQTGVNQPSAYAGRFKIYENESVIATYSSAINESSKSYTPSSSSVTSIKVEMYTAGGFTTKIDEQSILVVSDGATGSEGAGAITPIISNSNHSIPTDYLGGSGVYTGSGTTIRLFEGSTELDYNGVGTTNSSWKVTVSATGITAGTLTDSGAYVTIGDHSNMTADKATITYTITGKRANGFNISTTVVQNLTKVKSGQDGQPGANATSYWLISSAGVLQKSALGVFNPATVTFSAITKTGTSNPTAYGGRFKIYENGSATPTYTSIADEVSKIYTPSNSSVSSIKAELYLSGGTTSLIDEHFMPVVYDGAQGESGLSAVTPLLSNDAHTVPTDWNGNNGTYTGSGTLIRVFEGTTELLYTQGTVNNGNWTMTAVGTGISVGTLTDSGTYATVGDHSNMTTDTASIAYNITGKRTNGTAFTLTTNQSFSKAKQGGPGANAVVYFIRADAVAIQKSVTSVYTPSVLNIAAFSALGNNLAIAHAGRFIIATSLDGSTYSNVYTSAADESTYVYTIPVGIRSFRIRFYQAGGTTTLLDEQIIPIVSDGNNGNTGATGAAGAPGTAGTPGVAGDSFRIAYSKTTLGTLSSTPTSISTSGSTSFPPVNSWGTGTIWSGSPSPLNAGESLYQTNGVYSPTSGVTVWSVPYLSNLKVGSLSAISADLGSITGGAINIGGGKFAVDSAGNTVIKSSSTGARLEIKNNSIRVYDDLGNIRVVIGDLSA